MKDISLKKYEAICKIHSKKSTYRADGELIRKAMYEGLLGSSARISEILYKFSENPEIGLIGPSQYLLRHTDKNMMSNETNVNAIANFLGIPFCRNVFFAGSMFWFRQSALMPLLELDTNLFEPETGLIDGGYPHAVERLFCAIAHHCGYEVKCCTPKMTLPVIMQDVSPAVSAV